LSLCGELQHVQSEVNASEPLDVGGSAEGGDRPRDKSKYPHPLHRHLN
jgi:hypothetical protein